MTKDSLLMLGPFRRTAEENDFDAMFFVNLKAFSV